jgi:phytoene synthase
MSTRELDAAGITDPVLRASYQRCKELNAQHGKTYYLATLLLPPEKRPYVHALYGFARYADEIVDDLSSTLTEQQKADWLGTWGDAFLRDARNGHSDRHREAVGHSARALRSVFALDAP